jgi:hypothetical protein
MYAPIDDKRLVFDLVRVDIRLEVEQALRDRVVNSGEEKTLVRKAAGAAGDQPEQDGRDQALCQEWNGIDTEISDTETEKESATTRPARVEHSLFSDDGMISANHKSIESSAPADGGIRIRSARRSGAG